MQITKSKNELAASFQRARAMALRAKSQTKQVAARSLQGILTAGAGAMVGELRGRYGTGPKQELNIPGTDVDADLAFGAGATLLGISGLADEYSEHLVSVGSGALAGWLAISRLLVERKA